MAHHVVRAGDTLWAIAERCYGDGRLWSYLADHNPLAAAGILYEGQCLEAPPLPGSPRALADAYRCALPLGHAPVKVRLDSGGPLFRYDSYGFIGVKGLVGELIFHRLGPVYLGELTAANLLGYRLEQLAWAKEVFLRHFCTATVACGSFPQLSTGPNVAWHRYYDSGPGYAITGQIGAWEFSNVNRCVTDGPTDVRMSLEMNPAELFHSATLVLGDLPAPWGAPSERLVPLGRVLRAACPHLISPMALWMVTRDESAFLQPPPTPTMPAREADWTAPRATPPPSAPKRKKSAPTLKQKKRQVEKRPAKERKGEERKGRKERGRGTFQG
jgi:hypothetical protein